MTTEQPLDLDAIEAKTVELRARIDRKNPWPSDNESHWHAEGWKSGTRNALDKLHPGTMAAEIRRLRDQVQFLLAAMARQSAESGTGEEALREFLTGDDQPPANEPEPTLLRWGLDAEETHVVTDDSNDPEHVDDCPGCPSAEGSSRR
jgi:hypothetical protein